MKRKIEVAAAGDTCLATSMHVDNATFIYYTKTNKCCISSAMLSLAQILLLYKRGIWHRLVHLLTAASMSTPIDFNH